MMNRRDILKYTALATGAAIGAPLMSTLLSGCKTDPPAEEGGDVLLAAFNPAEFALVTQMADLILPKTDSPSATDVGVHHMIDRMVGSVYPEPDRKAYKAGFAALAKHLEGAGFAEADAEKQLSLLRDLDAKTAGASEEVQQAFLDFKQQTIAYYLNTEEIGTKFLNYLPVPGEYMPCITVEEAGGKAWAE